MLPVYRFNDKHVELKTHYKADLMDAGLSMGDSMESIEDVWFNYLGKITGILLPGFALDRMLVCPTIYN